MPGRVAGPAAVVEDPDCAVADVDEEADDEVVEPPGPAIFWPSSPVTSRATPVATAAIRIVATSAVLADDRERMDGPTPGACDPLDLTRALSAHRSWIELAVVARGALLYEQLPSRAAFPVRTADVVGKRRRLRPLDVRDNPAWRHLCPLSALRAGPLGPRSAASRDTRLAAAPLMSVPRCRERPRRCTTAIHPSLRRWRSCSRALARRLPGRGAG